MVLEKGFHGGYPATKVLMTFFNVYLVSKDLLAMATIRPLRC
jgi:hypothetical protein